MDDLMHMKLGSAKPDGRVDRETQGIFITEPPKVPKKQREKQAELFFEQYGVERFYLELQQVSALRAAGRTTGVVVDCGAGMTNAVPVFEGFIMPHGVQHVDFGGQDIDAYLARAQQQSSTSDKGVASVDL